MENYLNVLREYATFDGRARRTEFWMFVLFNFLATIVAEIVDGVLVNGLLGVSLPIITILYTLAVLVPSLAVAIRRLHDTGRSGWWLLIGLVPLAGPIVLIVFYATEGQPMPNAYGPDPKAFVHAQPQPMYGPPMYGPPPAAY